MKNKKNKKKIISIAALVASFVLCIGATFGITLAYFGGNASADIGSITLKTGIEVNASSTVTTSGILVVPGQTATVDATGKVVKTTQGTPGNDVVPGIMRVKFLIGGKVAGQDSSLGAITVAGGDASTYWAQDGDYFYLVTAGTAGTKTLKTLTADQSATIKATIVVDTELDNTDSGKTLEVTAVFEVAQGELYNGATKLEGNTLTYDNDIVKAAFTAIAA